MWMYLWICHFGLLISLHAQFVQMYSTIYVFQLCVQNGISKTSLVDSICVNYVFFLLLLLFACALIRCHFPHVFLCTSLELLCIVNIGYKLNLYIPFHTRKFIYPTRKRWQKLCKNCQVISRRTFYAHLMFQHHKICQINFSPSFFITYFHEACIAF